MDSRPKRRPDSRRFRTRYAEEWSDLVERLPEIRDLNPPVVSVHHQLPLTSSERLKVAHRWHVDCATGEVTHIS
jgi:hypothetical protein